MNIFENREISLYGVYQKAFFSKAFEEKLVSPVEMHGHPLDIGRLAESDYQKLYKHNPKKTSVLQMFLIFDRVTLIHAPPEYDYSRLTKTGLIDVITYEDENMLLGSDSWDLATRRYAMHLKPLIMPRLMSGLSKTDRNKIKACGLSPRVFCSIIFDMYMLQSYSTFTQEEFRKVDRFIKMDEDARLDIEWEKCKKHGISEEMARERIRFHWAYSVTESTGILMTLLDICTLKNSVVLQNEYREERLNTEETKRIISNIDKQIESYGIVKMSCEDLIGALPKLSSVQEVIKLKESRGKDIERLRVAISEVEHSLREGRSNAIKKSDEIVQKAIKEVNYGLELQKVSNWSTYMSLPVAVIEILFGLSPLSGITVGTIGTVGKIGSEIAIKKNNWTSVIR